MQNLFIYLSFRYENWKATQPVKNDIVFAILIKIYIIYMNIKIIQKSPPLPVCSF